MRRLYSVLIVAAALTVAESAAAQANPTYWNNANATHAFVGNLLTPWNSYYVSTTNTASTYQWFDVSQLYADAAMVQRGATAYIPYMNNTYWFIGNFWNGGSPYGGYFAAAAPNGTGVATDRMYTDDNALAGVAYLDAYDAITDPTMRANYLGSAQAIANYLMQSGIWETSTGGGFRWNTVDTWKPAQSNGLAIQLFARLYQKTGQTYYRDWALSINTWLDANLRDPADGLYKQQTNVGFTRKFTYDQAIMIEAKLLLRDITGNAAHLTAAQTIANNMHTKLWSSSYGGYRIRTDSVDGGWRMSPTFGGWASQSLVRLYQKTNNATYLTRAKQNANFFNTFLRHPTNGGYYASCEHNGTYIDMTQQTVDQAWMQRIQAILSQYP